MQSQDQTQHEKFAELLDSRYRHPDRDRSAARAHSQGRRLDRRCGVSLLSALLGRAAVLGRMFINILLDVLIGAIPVLGEIFDIYWKANERNVEILKELEQNPERTTTESRFWIWAVFVQLVALIVAVLLFIGWLIAELLSLLFG